MKNTNCDCLYISIESEAFVKLELFGADGERCKTLLNRNEVRSLITILEANATILDAIRQFEGKNK